MNRPRADKTFRPELHADINQSIMRAFSRAVNEELVKNEDGVIMPAFFGTLRIFASKRRSLDKRKTAELGFPVFHQNYATDGYTFIPRLYWNYEGHIKRRRKSKHPMLFKFKAYPKLNIAMFEHISAGHWDHYYKID